MSSFNHYPITVHDDIDYTLLWYVMALYYTKTIHVQLAALHHKLMVIHVSCSDSQTLFNSSFLGKIKFI